MKKPGSTWFTNENIQGVLWQCYGIFPGDFERFATWLHRPDNQAHVKVRRLANIILANFDGVAQTIRHRSQRSIYQVEQARRLWAEAPNAPPDIHPIAVEEYRCLRAAALARGPCLNN